MLTKTETTKRKQLYLSNEEKWEIAKWCIENKCVIQDIHAYKEQGPAFIPFTLWRVRKNQAKTELNRLIKSQNENKEYTEHHLNISVQFYNEICELTGSHPNVPAIEDTVEMDILTAKVKRQENEIKEIAEKYATLQSAYDAVMKSHGTLFQAMRNIANNVPPECFGNKIPPDRRVTKP